MVSETWRQLSLGEVATLQRGYDLPHKERKPGAVPIISSSGSIDTHNESRAAGPGVVTGRYGTIGEVFFVSEDFWPLNTTLFVKDFKGNDPLFISFLLRTIDYHSYSGKSGVPGVNRNDLHEIGVSLPPLPEQRAIATALSDVDTLITSLDRLIAKKRNIKQATMQQLLTGRARLPGFSEEWKVKKVEEIAPLQRGFDLPTSQLKEGVYPVVYSNGILNHHSSFKVKAPGVVTGRSGTIGKVNYIEDDYWPHNTTLWVTDYKGNLPKYIYYLYMNIKLERFGTGSGVPTMNRNDVHSYQIPIPPFLEQQATAAILTDMTPKLPRWSKSATRRAP